MITYKKGGGLMVDFISSLPIGVQYLVAVVLASGVIFGLLRFDARLDSISDDCDHEEEK